ncbi:hypothetical protein F5Y15DRAFT_256476 [Xylariaceae sp. FL0016]|nr:hypothetical protein F5Y15DRAFT_256476 [Xylariaceae sp. FL0016]
MSDTQEEASQASTRIKRNTACTSCRDAKVRCNPSSNPNHPCQRCGKLHLSCVVDKTHKRVSRKSKLDELVQEIQAIKQSVGSGSLQSQTPSKQHQHQMDSNAFSPLRDTTVPVLGTSSPSTATSGPTAAASNPPSAPTPALHTSVTTVPREPVEPSLFRALGSHPFPGEDIDYYFQKYFECYHPHMPIVRQRDPNKCYDAAPLLFWTIIFIACRRHAKTPTTLSFLMHEVRRQLLSSLSSLPLSISSINAFILVSTWNFPDVRFVNDPAALFFGVTGSATLQLGIQTGKGAHPEYSYNVFQNSFTDEEACYTWAGHNIIAQRVSSYLGLPPIGGLFNQAVQNIIDGRTSFHVPSGFRIQLECQKFCNRVSKIMVGYLEESRGVSSYVVKVLEDEWDGIKGLICSEKADELDRLNALLVQLEIQIYYMIPTPVYDREGLKRLILRTYNTAQTVIRNALALDRKTDFLLYAPHFQFRTLLTACCVIYKLLRSSYMRFIDRRAAEQSASDGIALCKRATVMEADLPMRLGKLLGPWFEVWQDTDITQWQEEPISSFSHRLSASLALDCLMRWKNDQNLGQKSQQQQQQATTATDDGTNTPGVLPGSSADPLMNIDWNFMDDFDWNFDQQVAIPQIDWQGMPR